MILFRFYENLKFSFLHDAHIWLWGLFTLLDALAHSAVYWQRHPATTGRRCDHYYYCPIVTHSTATALPLIGIGEEDTLCTRASFKYDYYVLLQHHQVQNTNKLQHEQLHQSSLPSRNKMITSAVATTTLPAALDFRPMTATAVQAIKVRKQFYS